MCIPRNRSRPQSTSMPMNPQRVMGMAIIILKAALGQPALA